jgi:peptidoglycan hydrolase-like protein with peptidoglycan-binding domain
MQISLSKRISTDSAASPLNVKSLKKGLNRLGHYTPEPRLGITQFPDAAMFAGLKAFQKAEGLPVTGVIKPDDPTFDRLNEKLRAQEDDPSLRLVWHCAMDKNSCDACEARDGTLVDSASENTPECRGNCRCWVTPLQPSEAFKIYDPPIEKVYPELYLLPATQLSKTVSLGMNLLKVIKQKPSKEIKTTRSQLQRKFKHAKVFGIVGNANKRTLEQFENALQKHSSSARIRIIKGSYRGKKVIHYYDSETNINIIQDFSGKFISAWKLSKDQVYHILKNGRL